VIPGDDGTESCNSGCCTSYDGFEIGIHSQKGNVADAFDAANKATAAQDWSFV
jgi:mannan endo-1,4-beta-mannosidase